MKCSIYFNTFYNAETAFEEGLVLHQKVLRNFPDSLVVEPPGDVRTKYDRAIEKATKVLDVYPKDKKWHDDALFLLGKSNYYEKNFSKSIRWLRQLQEEYPESKYIPESYIYIAKAYIGQEDLAKAEEILNFTLDRYPKLDNDQDLSLLLVEIAIRREGKSQAIVLLEKAQASVRSEEKRQELLLRIAELYMDLKQYEKAVGLLDTAPRNKKDPLREYRIDRNIVLCYIELDSLDRALASIKNMLASKIYVPYTKDILLVKGTILAHQGKINEAIAVFKLIIGDTQDTVKMKNDTSRIVSRALFELASLYQRKKGSYKDAEKYYRIVTERSVKDTSVAPIAQKRLDAIKRLSDLRTKLASRDTTLKRREARFTIGEVFYYELEEPDSSFAQFMQLAADSARDSLFTPKSLCAAAAIARKEFKDTLLSDSLYRRLVAEYPGSDYIDQAKREMQSAHSLKTRKEQAEMSFRDAEKKWLYENDVKGAVQAFFNTYKEYTDLEIAPKSLFVAAWLTDNELQKKKTAKSLYEKICDRFPKSLYCINEAQPRLKTVIDTLEALRRMRKEGQNDTGKKASAVTSTAGSAAPVIATADSSSPLKTPIDTLDVPGAIGLDTTAGSPAKFPDTDNSFRRRPGYRGNLTREAPKIPDTGK
jgi:TolA-binding protein